MIRIDDKGRCCGCGACAQICPKGCITMRVDGEGFAYPSVDESACVGCGRCDAVCPILRADGGELRGEAVLEQPLAVGGWHRDAAIREASSSGGAFTLLAGEILRRGGVVFGAAMVGREVRHVAAETEAELGPMRGSKYVQSLIGDTYRQAREHLEAGRPVLFTGTPCQTAGLMTYLGKPYGNLVLVDFICHGVPSPKVFAQYLDSVEKQADSRIVAFSFREKDRGWHPSGLQMGTRARFENGGEVRRYPALRDSYMNGFLEDIYLRPCCYECRFKQIPKHTADITIADFWGVDKAMPEMNDGRGTSLLLIHDEKGRALFDAVKDGFEYRECDWRKALVKNPTLLRSARPTPLRERFFEDLESGGYDRAARRYLSTGRTVVRKGSRMVGAKVEALLVRLIAALLGILHIQPKEGTQEKLLQFVKFCMVGVTNVIVSYTTNILTLFVVNRLRPGFRWDYVVANIVAFLVAVYWSFYWNSRKVFHFTPRDRALRRRALFRSYLCYGFTGIVLNNLLSTLWIRGLGISKLISPLINLLFTIPLNYLTNKKWAFAVKPKEDK